MSSATGGLEDFDPRIPVGARVRFLNVNGYRFRSHATGREVDLNGATGVVTGYKHAHGICWRPDDPELRPGPKAGRGVAHDDWSSGLEQLEPWVVEYRVGGWHRMGAG